MSYLHPVYFVFTDAEFNPLCKVGIAHSQSELDAEWECAPNHAQHLAAHNTKEGLMRLVPGLNEEDFLVEED